MDIRRCGRRRQAALRFGWLLGWTLLCCHSALADDASAQEQIAIAQPQDQSTVFDNSGHVDVQLVVSPALELRPGDRIQLLFDGRALPPVQESGYALDHVDRGAHRLQARIVDSSGRALVESSPVTFFMWQASRNFPSRHR